jgi:hypothetical protein
MENVEQSVVVRQETGVESAATADEIVARVKRMQEIVSRVMKENEHFGVIPGCKKKSLYAAGAELLMMTFGVAPQVERVEDLSTPDEIRYRVTVAGISRSGAFLGNHTGECSSSEEKYKWRKIVCQQEFDETPEDRRREVWKVYKEKPYQAKQIRTNPADVANTILAMAEKRGVVGMVRKVTGASSMFTDGIEDLPPGMLDTTEKKTVTMPKEKAVTPAPDGDRQPDREPTGELPLDAAGEIELTGVIKSVSRKPGKSSRGDYIKCGVCIVTDTGEQWANTFDTRISDEAEALRGRQAVLHVRAGKFGLELLTVSAGKKEGLPF